MTEIAKSDLFFFITTISIAVISLLLAILIIYAFFIVRSVKKVVDKVKEESIEVIEDIQELRMRLKENDNAIKRASALFFFFRNIFARKKPRRSRKED